MQTVHWVVRSRRSFAAVRPSKRVQTPCVDTVCRRSGHERAKEEGGMEKGGGGEEEGREEGTVHYLVMLLRITVHYLVCS